MLETGRLRLGFATVALLLLWISLAIAASALWPVYRSDRFVVMAAVTIGVGTLIALVGAVRRWPSILVGAVSALAFLLLGVPLAVPSGAAAGFLPTLPGLRDLLGGVALGWKQLLTIPLPVGSFQALLVPAFALLLTASVVGGSVLLRARYGELAVIAPLVVFVAAILFGPEQPSAPVPTALGMLVSVLLVLLWRRWYRRRAAIRMLGAAGLASGAAADGRALADAAGTEAVGDGGDRVRRPPRTVLRDAGFPGGRTLLTALVLIALAGVASVGAASALPPTQPRQVLRSTIEQPFDPRAYPSPLSAYRSWLAQPTADRALFTVQGLPSDGRIRVATMDTYDGVVYAVGTGSGSGTFTRVPSSLDQPAGPALRMRVQLDDYSGPWVPDAGRLSSIEFAGPRADQLTGSFFYNQQTGTAAVVAGLRPGDAYTFDGVQTPQSGEQALASATPGAAQVPAPAVVPDGLQARLAQYVGTATTPGAKLVAALEGLKRDGYISHGIGADEPASRSGHAADRIAELFSAQVMVGDAEQYAVAAALMADELGFPARVVFGFQPPADGRTASGTVTVRGSDATAWIEVDTAASGWVAVDPNPAVRPIPEQQPEDPTRISRPQTVLPPPQAPDEPRQDAQPPEANQQDQQGLDPLLVLLLQIGTAVAWVLLVLGILAAPFLAVVTAKVRRRRRRRMRPDTRARIAGGWDEFEDTALDHGYAPPASATRSEVAETVGGTRSRLLAAVADRAVFAPDEPDPEDAERVWRAVDELSKAMAARSTRRERIRAALSLRSLRRYSGDRRRGRSS